MFTGSLVALVTPFANGEVDYETLRELVNFQIKSGTDGIVPTGTTGESPTLTHDEHKQVIKVVVEEVAGRVPVIAGTGSNSTAEALSLTAFARQVGADGSLQVLPYYNKPTQEGMYQHFLTIAQEVDLPMILYNIPGRCGVNLEPRTIVKLAEIENIVGIKEASGQLDQVSQIALSTSLTILSGDDSLTLPIASVGGKGVISVVANIVPTDVKALTDAILEGDFATARQWHNKLFTLASTMLGLATNPIPIKTAMGLLHLSSPQMRLPMVGLSDSKLQILEQVLTEYGLIN